VLHLSILFGVINDNVREAKLYFAASNHDYFSL